MLVIANWKANKTWEEAKNWVDKVSPPKEIEVIICPPALWLKPLLDHVREKELSFKTGLQDVSLFAVGQYTGEIPAELSAQYADFAIIGHTERRKYFKETDDIVHQKIKRCLESGIKPIVAIGSLTQAQNFSDMKNEHIMYEPPSSISRGGDYQKIDFTILTQEVVKLRGLGFRKILYGGSINQENIKAMLELSVEGFVVGNASLDATEFQNLLCAVIEN